MTEPRRPGRVEGDAAAYRDPDLCEATGCEEVAAVATPAGPLCQRHADSLADELGLEGGRRD